MDKIIKKIEKLIKTVYMPMIIGILYLVVMAIIYHQRTASFIFFDEYANYISAYFMEHGRVLYSQNFSNHQMLPIYISYIIQRVLHPQSLYSLYLYHRLFIILFSFAFGIFLLYRMRWIAFGFILIFEITKYYLFGNLFLGESMIVYPIVYLFYLSWQHLTGKHIADWELILSGVLAWFIVFSRVPYVPLALLLYIVVIFNRKFSKYSIISLGVFLVLSLITVLTVPLKDYFYQIIYVSYSTVFLSEVQKTQSAGLGPLAIVFYPFFIFFKGQATFFRWILMLLSGLFLVSFITYLIKTRKFILGIFIFIVLSFANVRPVSPGTEFYSAFYLIQWYALFITTIFILIYELRTLLPYRYVLPFLVAALGIFLFITVSPQSFLWDKFNAKSVFSFQYDMFYVNGQAMKVMARKNSTMFVDMSDSLLYWTAGLPSSYKYGVYYPVMDNIPTYRNEKLKMFLTRPPDFYYVNCLEGIANFNWLPQRVTSQYSRMVFNNSPTCFLVRKDLLKNLTDQQMSQLESLRFSMDNRLREKK